MAEQDSEAGFSVLCIPFAVPALWGSGNHREYRKRGKEQRQITSGCCKENGFDFTGTPPKGAGGPRDLGSFGSLGHSLGGTR